MTDANEPKPPADEGRLERRVGRPVEKRGNIGVLQKRSCLDLLLCYSNHIDSATGEMKWRRNK